MNYLSDSLCDLVCAEARKMSAEMGLDISFAICDASGLLRVFHRFGEALVLSVTLVPGKAYTSAVTQFRTSDVDKAVAEGAALMAIQTNDPRITLVAGGYPLFAEGKIVGGLGVGGTEEQDFAIAEHLVKLFNEQVSA